MSQPEKAPAAERAGLRDRLTRDHARLERLFEELRAALDADASQDAARLWGELDQGLGAHMAFEECHVLPAFRTVDRREADDLLREHVLIRRRLIELGVGVDLHLVRVEVVADFIALLRAHARREDALLYLWAEQALPESAQSLFQAASPAGKAARATSARPSGG
ncbi:MAG: hemerythrin domain-containing protein [Deltaproteobacteria bacterium]